MIFLVMFLITSSMTSWALVPVEGILRGQAALENQQDPLKYIFPKFTEQEGDEAKRLKLYYHRYLQGEYLNNNCRHYVDSKYAEPWEEAQARRSIVATLQYMGMDTAIKAVGAYAKELGVDELSYMNLANNLVTNYCSPNITIHSHKTINASLIHYYKNPEKKFFASIENSPYATEIMKDLTGTKKSRDVEFQYSIEMFRDFCSWGNDVTDYRMLAPYMKNRFIMSFLFENIIGIAPHYNEEKKKVEFVEKDSDLKVSCNDFICRASDKADFLAKLPMSIGSTGLKTDLEKMYCSHFRYQDYRNDTLPEIKEWIKNQSLEAPVFRELLLTSFITGVPESFLSIPDFREVPNLIKSSMDDRWSKWANDVLKAFSKDLYYEESMKINILDKSDLITLISEGYSLDLIVTLGEMDKMLGKMDKISSKFNVRLSRNQIQWFRKEWNKSVRDANYDVQTELHEKMRLIFREAISHKEKHYLQKIWNDDLPRILAREFLTQVIRAPDSWFEHGIEDKMVNIPVTFYYGMFAMNYLKYRDSQVTGSEKLKF